MIDKDFAFEAKTATEQYLIEQCRARDEKIKSIYAECEKVCRDYAESMNSPGFVAELGAGALVCADRIACLSSSDQVAAINWEKVDAMLSCEIECSVFEKHVQPAIRFLMKGEKQNG